MKRKQSIVMMSDCHFGSTSPEAEKKFHKHMRKIKMHVKYGIAIMGWEIVDGKWKPIRLSHILKKHDHKK